VSQNSTFCIGKENNNWHLFFVMGFVKKDATMDDDGWRKKRHWQPPDNVSYKKAWSFNCMTYIIITNNMKCSFVHKQNSTLSIQWSLHCMRVTVIASGQVIASGECKLWKQKAWSFNCMTYIIITNNMKCSFVHKQNSTLNIQWSLHCMRMRVTVTVIASGWRYDASKQSMKFMAIAMHSTNIINTI